MCESCQHQYVALCDVFHVLGVYRLIPLWPWKQSDGQCRMYVAKPKITEQSQDKTEKELLCRLTLFTFCVVWGTVYHQTFNRSRNGYVGWSVGPLLWFCLFDVNEIVSNILGSPRMNPWWSLTFPLALQWSLHFYFLVKCLNNYRMDCHNIW